jgi:hypothetical protein
MTMMMRTTLCREGFRLMLPPAVLLPALLEAPRN